VLLRRRCREISEQTGCAGALLLCLELVSIKSTEEAASAIVGLLRLAVYTTETTKEARRTRGLLLSCILVCAEATEEST